MNIHSTSSHNTNRDKLKGTYQPDFSPTYSNKTVKYQQIGEQQIVYRFNEWEPFSKSNDAKQLNERQKSSQQKAGKLSSSVDHSRQTSGRGFLQSATNSQMHMHIPDRQQPTELSFGGLELVVSGQKLGVRENISSPTTTPRENNPAIRPLTRRLHPIDRLVDPTTQSSTDTNEQIVKQIKQTEAKKIKQKK